MKDQILDLSKKLIKIPSTKESIENLKKVIEEAVIPVSEFKRVDFISNSIPSVLVHNQEVQPENFKVILNGHLDVVPGREDQFDAFVKDGKLYGRGAIDMKAATAAQILAFAEVAGKVSYPLGLQLVADEEIGGYAGTKYQSLNGVVSEFYTCGEYSFLDIGLEAKGILWVKVTAHGMKAHGAYPWKGDNAIAKLNQEIAKLIKTFKNPDKESWKTTMNIGLISGGKAVNQVPDEASVTLDIRRIPDELPENILVKIKSGLIYPDTTVEVLTNEPANQTKKDSPFIHVLAKTIKSVTGKSPKYLRFNRASDARHYSALGTTAIDFGPAGDGLHSDEEWVDIVSLVKYYEILKKFLLSIN